MDYEKKYNEALNWMRELYPGLHGATKEDAEHYFPELRESEDERIRKGLIKLLTVASEAYLVESTGINKDSYLAYIEKQEQKPKQEWSEEDEEMLECVIMDVESAKKNYLKSTTQVVRQGAILADKELAWLKSLRPQPKRDCKDCAMFLNGKCTKPHWKPSEEHLSALLAIFNDPNNIGSQTCQLALSDLYEQLMKL